MGNHKFRFSNMLPNTWFYKLRDMNKTKNHVSKKKKIPFSSEKNNPKFSQPTSSYYYKNYFLDSPRKSSKKITNYRKSIYNPSPKHNIPSLSTKNNYLEFDFFNSSPSNNINQFPSCHNSCNCQFNSSSNDIIMDINGNVHTKEFKNLDERYDTLSNFKLPPIVTKKTAKFRGESTVPRSVDRLKVKVKVNVPKPEKFDGSKWLKKEMKDQFLPTSKEGSRGYKSVSLKSSSHSSGVKLRKNSTKIACRKNGPGYKSVPLKRRLNKQNESSLTGSFAIIKTSIDPEKDFKESMMEMVVENNIKASQDLENLLACYLTLNSIEYHDLIIKAFQQIWFNLPYL